uniref:Vesicular, overexpressed in cancer, prosurvival protein 1 n=1 Tax=Anguilla anguilla TaxID=7936 RepID=A0A0E9W2Z0_ANGAN
MSIYMSAFACRVLCGCSTGQVVYMPPTSNQVASENLLIPAPNSCQTTVNYTHYPTVMGSMQTARPPQYEVRP